MTDPLDDLTASLATSFQVSFTPNTTAAEHPRFAQYKAKKTGSSQDARRDKILDSQKRQRLNYLNLMRHLAEDDWYDADVIEDDGPEEDMEMEVRIWKPGRHFKNQLMLSEWLVEVPDDFEKEWTMVICPVGRRCLVVASRGKTRVYAKCGVNVNTFQSFLPGGGHNHSRGCTILDCLFNEVEQTYYILDLMCWGDHPIYDSETEFRLFWLNSKMVENPELEQYCKINKFKFMGLPQFPCTTNSIQDAVATANFEIDGILFYHKRTHYTFGSTPLVVWLKPYMLPEILGIEVPEKHMEKKPESYTNYTEHMESVKEKQTKDDERRKKNEEKRKEERLKSPRGMDNSGDNPRFQPEPRPHGYKFPVAFAPRPILSKAEKKEAAEKAVRKTAQNQKKREKVKEKKRLEKEKRMSESSESSVSANSSLNTSELNTSEGIVVDS